MFRKLAAILLIALALAVLAVYARAVMAPLTLLVGSGAVSLVQNGAITNSTPGASGPIAFTLPAASTAGTTLLAITGTGGNVSPVLVSMPAGWTRLINVVQGAATLYEAWLYPNNPGGIVGFQAQVTHAGGGRWATHISEWSNVWSASATVLESSGSATATAGTTLTPTTTTVVNQRDLAVAGWTQAIAGSASVFTSPSGFTRLTDNGAVNLGTHIDLEYIVNPALGSLAPTLTSDTTTVQAAGATIVLKAAPPVTDQTAMLAY